MNALLRKEIRLVLPAWIIALVLATFPVWIFWPGPQGPQTQTPGAPVLVPFAIGVLLLGLASFGHELSFGTFSLLLAQPMSRRRLWFSKTIVLFTAILGVLAALWISTLLQIFSAEGMLKLSAWSRAFQEFGVGGTLWRLLTFHTLYSFLAVGGLIALTTFASVLWTTLLFRQVSAALWFTILVPSFMTTFVWFFLEKKSEAAAFIGVSLILLLYSVAGFFWARRMFLRAQDVAWTGGNISFPSWLESKPKSSSAFQPRKLQPMRALLRKELLSHQVSLLIGAVLLVTHLIGIAVRKLALDPGDPHQTALEILGFWWLLWFALPMIIGATVVAEERKQGTLEAQLGLPVKRGVQFGVKLLVALVLGVFLGGVVPGLCESLATGWGVPGIFPSAKAPEPGTWIAVCCSIATAATLTAFYASTLTRNLLQALGTAVVVGTAFCAFGMFIVIQEKLTTPLWTGPLGIWIGAPILIAIIFWQEINNFKSLQVGMRLWLRNATAVLAGMAFVVLATALVWNRVWELAMTLEPARGAAKLIGDVRPSIGLGWYQKIFVLLPDGRVWVEDEHRMIESGEEEVFNGGERQIQKVQFPVPVRGTFLTGSNWVQIATTSRSALAVRADGSLWNLFTANPTNGFANLDLPPKLERVGSDSDWKTVVGGWSGFFALKHDGSIWWDPYGELTPFGYGSDWTELFAAREVVGIKADGSVWKLSGLQYGPPGPLQSYPAGGNWKSIDMLHDFDLLIKGDGTLWACGFNRPERILGYDMGEVDPAGHFEKPAVRIGPESDYSDIQSDWNSILVLKSDGTVVESKVYERHLALWGGTWKPSRNSDWIAIQLEPWARTSLTLAADGTLTAWEDPLRYTETHPRALLGPTRKPLWSLNILTANQEQP